MNDRIDAVLVDTSVYHKRQCDFEGITNSIIPMLLQLLRAMEEVMRLNSDRQYCRDIRISAKEVEKLLPRLFFFTQKQQGGRTTP